MKESQGRGITANLSDEVALGRHVNYVNISVVAGEVTLDLGMMQPAPPPETQVAEIVLRAGMSVNTLSVLHATIGQVLTALSAQQQPKSIVGTGTPN